MNKFEANEILKNKILSKYLCTTNVSKYESLIKGNGGNITCLVESGKVKTVCNTGGYPSPYSQEFQTSITLAKPIKDEYDNDELLTLRDELDKAIRSDIMEMINELNKNSYYLRIEPLSYDDDKVITGSLKVYAFVLECKVTTNWKDDE